MIPIIEFEFYMSCTNGYMYLTILNIAFSIDFFIVVIQFEWQERSYLKLY